MDEAAEKVLRPELGERERLLWAGRPRQGVRLRRVDLVVVPFTFCALGFAVFWEVAALTLGAPFIFPLMGSFVVAFGLYISVGRLVLDVIRRGRMFYGLTNHRALIVSISSSRDVKSVDRSSFNTIWLAERRDRSGTITFGFTAAAAVLLGPHWPGARSFPPAFEMIEGVRDVYDQIRSLY